MKYSRIWELFLYYAVQTPTQILYPLRSPTTAGQAVKKNFHGGTSNFHQGTNKFHEGINSCPTPYASSFPPDYPLVCMDIPSHSSKQARGAVISMGLEHKACTCRVLNKGGSKMGKYRMVTHSTKASSRFKEEITSGFGATCTC